MATISYSGTRPVKSRPTDPVPDVGGNLALMLTARRRRHLHRTAWLTR